MKGGITAKNIILYSTGCPRCKMLKLKLDSTGIDYIVNDNKDEMLSRNMWSVPQLEVDGQILDYSEALRWITNEENNKRKDENK